MTKVAILLIVGISVASAGFLLHIIGMSTTHWIEDKNAPVHAGIFRVCDEVECFDIPSPRSEGKAVQAMAILAVLSGGAGIWVGTVFACFVARGKSPMKLIRLVSAFLCLGAGLWVLICVTVYRAKIYRDIKEEPSDVKLGYSFGFTSTAGPLFFVAGILILVGQGYEEERYTT